ncbi:hypothetical protein LRY29_00405 [Candidatus Saccharibacteria bacterium]|nr:hypothetical protein [Candidatus Saccharibacteria bacterium]
MDRTYEPVAHIHTPETAPRIIEYPALVDAVQLSVARLLDIDGSLAAREFSELLVQHSPDRQSDILREIEPHFDQALLSFVTAALVAEHHRTVIILAHEAEGFNGHLPWEGVLRERAAALQRNGLAAGGVRIERYTDAETRVSHLPTASDTAHAHGEPQLHVA